MAYDITAACSGFVLGLVSAACHIRGNGFVYFAAMGSVGSAIKIIELYLCKLQEVDFKTS